MTISPTAEGFRAAFRRPSVTLAEIAWRWVVGGTAVALFFFGFVEYLNTLPVSNRELLLLRSGQPYLVGQAIAHILHGSLGRGVLSLLLAGLLVSVLWIVAASLGRIATVRALMEYFAGRFSGGGTRDIGERDVASNVSTNVIALSRISFLRVALVVAAFVGFFGAAILASFVSPDADPRPGLAFLVFVPFAALILLITCGLNWLLSLAGLFAVRDGEDALGAISGAVTFYREHTGAVAAVSAWTGLAHVVAFVAASTVVSTFLGLAALLPWRVVVLIVATITLAYFVVADWLYTARLAGYVCILDMPEAVSLPTPPSEPQGPSRIDRDELILSDVPGLVAET